MDFSRFTTISFDCYGTLIDWESGILPVLRTLLANHGETLPDAGILELYAEFEARAESAPYQSYREVLQSVVREFAARFHFEATPTEIRALHESVPAWPSFPDTVPALHTLHKHYKLAVISNIDDDLFAETRKHLGVEFEAEITAEQARSYKPSINNFQMALRKLGIPPAQLLHAGAEYLSRCRPGAITRNLDSMGQPEVGTTRYWRDSSLCRLGFRKTAGPGSS